jgi:hypothetical protein
MDKIAERVAVLMSLSCAILQYIYLTEKMS